MADAGGATQTDPGLGGVFETLAPLFSPGYRIVFRPTIEPSQPESPPAFADPRGILPAGLAPASTLSYEVFDSVTELVVANNFRAAAAGVDLGFAQVVGQITANSQSFISLIVFEGKDVIDLPTDGLKSVGGGLVVPDLVFFPIHAGEKFIQSPTDDIAAKTALEYIHRSPNNAVRGVVPSINPPLDSLSNTKSVIPSGALRPIIDVASNAIKVEGGAKFVSYIAATKPLFRDVIFLNSSAIAQGVFIGNNFNISFVGPFGTPQVQVLRYAFINVSPEGQPAYSQWRLAESFGIQIDKKEETPPALITSLSEGSADLSEKEALHFIYDLADSKADIAPALPLKPIKIGYSPAFARAKMDPAGKFYDKKFKAQVLPSGQFFFQSRFQTKRIFGLTETVGSAANRIETDRSYTSQVYNLEVGPNTRIGVEYAVHKFNRTNAFSQDRLILLAATKPTSGGLTAFYDPCTKKTYLYMLDGNIVMQRVFNDKTWAMSDRTIPESKLKAFLIGESPQTSIGATAIFPAQEQILETSGSKGDVQVPADFAVTGAKFAIAESGEKPPILEIFSKKGSDGTPTYEIGIPVGKNGEAFISLPSIDIGSFNIANANGAEMKAIYGAKTDFLKDMVAPAVKTGENASDYFKLSGQQFVQNKAEKFPLEDSAIASATLSLYGSSYLAMENNGRIDIAYRPAQANSFVVIRDVCFRVPEDQTKEQLGLESKKNFYPAAANPFLLAVPQTSTIILFYEYKDRLLAKTIPHWIFASVSIDGPVLSVETEADLAARLNALIPNVVYDGGLADPKVGAKGDVLFSTIRFPEAPAAEEEASPGVTVSKSKPQIVQHSACRTLGGVVYCFIQDGQRIVLRRSSNNGQTWEDVLPQESTFLPAMKQTASEESFNQVQTNASTTVSDGDAPYCFFDATSQTILLFFMSSEALLCMIIPEKVLELAPEDAAAALKRIVPEVVYGSVSKQLADRGVKAQSTVLDRQSTKPPPVEKISPQRISTVRLEGGHLRTFFIDQQKFLRSIASSNDGKLWQTEDQYIASR